MEDCCCDYETVDSVNAEVLHPLLQEIVKTPFFRYFKVSSVVPSYLFYATEYFFLAVGNFKFSIQASIQGISLIS